MTANPEAEHLDLPFDQYNRHVLVTRAVHHLRGDPARRLRILDVGGYPCWTPRFLPDDDVTVLDVQAGRDASRKFVVGDGSALPFADRTFDIVVTLDSLEHVPRPKREAFLAELTRVARDYLLLTAPFGRPEVKLAEAVLDEFIRVTLKADHEQLAEHAGFGLPEVDEVEAIFGRLGCRFARLPSGNVHHWLTLMLAKHFVMTIPDSDDLHAALDRYYNAHFFEADQTEPAYRQLFLVAVGGDPAPLAAFVERQRSAPLDAAERSARLEQAQLLLQLLNLRASSRGDTRLQEQITARAAHIGQLEQARTELAATLDREVAKRDRDIAALQDGMRAQQEEIERLRVQARELRQQLLRLRGDYDSAQTEVERTRIMLAARDRDVERLNAHIQQIAEGRVMRLLNALQGRL